MSLEQALNENTVALNTLIALIKGGSLSAAAGKGSDDAGEAKGGKTNKSDDDGETKTTRSRKSSSKAADEAKSSKFTAEDVKVAAVKVKDALGTKEAKRLIAEHGAEELAKLKPENYEDFINACEAALKGDDDDNGDDEDGL